MHADILQKEISKLCADNFFIKEKIYGPEYTKIFYVIYIMSLKVIQNDTEIMKFWNLLTDQKKEGLFNFRSKNTIKKDNFKIYLQKLVNRLIDLNKYCRKYGISSEYTYFKELLIVFLYIIDKNTQIDIHPDILYDIKRNTFINYFKFLYDIYKYYLEEYKNFLIKNKKYSIKIELKNVENFTNNSNKIQLKTDFSGFSNRINNCENFFKNFNIKYSEYIEFILKINQLIQINLNKKKNIEKLNKEDIVEKNIEFLKYNIHILNQKLIDHIKKNRNNQLARNQRRKQISNDAEERKKHEVKPPVVRNWKSMYFRGNQYTPANTLPTDPIKIEQAKIRFEKILKKERLISNAKSCNDERQARTDENWQRCKLAENKLKQIEEENRAYKNTILPKLTNYDIDRIGRM